MLISWLLADVAMYCVLGCVKKVMGGDDDALVVSIASDVETNLLEFF